MKYGLSMFGLGPAFRKDPEGFFQRMTAAGYSYMEPCVMAQQIPQIKDHMWTFDELDKFYPLLQRYGWNISSLHVYPRNLSEEREGLISLAKKYDVPQLVIPCPQFETLEQGYAVAQLLTDEANRMHEEGVELLLHNGKNECVARMEGLSNYAWLLTHCGENVGSQADVGWLLYGGTDPVDFLERNRNRIRSLHYKDMEATSDGLVEIGVGRGLVDMAACFRFAKAADIVQLVDQDSSRGDILEDMEFVAKCFDKLAME